MDLLESGSIPSLYKKIIFRQSSKCFGMIPSSARKVLTIEDVIAESLLVFAKATSSYVKNRRTSF